MADDKAQKDQIEEENTEQTEPVEESVVEEDIDLEDTNDSETEHQPDQEVTEESIEEVQEEPEDVTDEKYPDTDDKTKIAAFRPGDIIKVFYKITEGGKTRIQPYEGIVISKKGSGVSKTFTVRRIGADSVGVERIFPLHSPNIEKIDVIKKGKSRRSKLYYLRGRVGKAAMKVKAAEK